VAGAFWGGDVAGGEGLAHERSAQKHVGSGALVAKPAYSWRLGDRHTAATSGDAVRDSAAEGTLNAGQVTWCVALDRVLVASRCAGNDADGGGDRGCPCSNHFGRQRLNRPVAIHHADVCVTAHPRDRTQHRRVRVTSWQHGAARPPETEGRVTRVRPAGTAQLCSSPAFERGLKGPPSALSWTNHIAPQRRLGKRDDGSGRDGFSKVFLDKRLVSPRGLDPSAGGNLAFFRVLVENLASCREWPEASLPCIADLRISHRTG
jgi:hypothetical protein